MTSLFRPAGHLIKEAWQRLRGHPGFMASVVVTMGLTAGTLICVATFAYLLLIKPLPYEGQDRLYRVDHRLTSPAGDISVPAFTYPGIIHLYENQDVFDETVLISYGNDVISSLPQQPMAGIGYVTPEWFSLFNASFELGRGFGATEAVDTNNPVAALSHETWLVEYGGDPDVIGQVLSLSGIDYRIVGVVADSYVEPRILGPGQTVGVWIPWDFNFGTRWRTDWGKFTASLTFIGKLREDISEAQAQQSIASMVDDTWQANFSGGDQLRDHFITVELWRFKDLILGDVKRSIYLLLAAALGLVAIATANISNLFMARTSQQEQTLAVRAAVGGKRKHIFAALFAESSLLMAMSCVVSLFVAAAGIQILKTYMSTVLPRVSELSIDVFSVVAAILVAATLAALFARLSTNIIDFRSLQTSLQASGKGSAIQVSQRTRRLLIASQIAIALALVFVNATLFQSAYKTIAQPLGYDIENIHFMSMSYAGRSRPPLDEVATVMTEVRRKLRQLPEVSEISQSRSPLGPGDFQQVMTRDSSNRIIAEARGIEGNYFSFIGQTLLEGSTFSESDTRRPENSDYNPIIVNDVLAKSLDEKGSVLGAAELPGFGQVSILGVAKGVRRPGEFDIPTRIFFPLNAGRTQLLIKVHPGQTLTRAQVGELLRDVDPVWSVWMMHELEDWKRQMLFAQTATAVTTAILTLVTCCLVAVGLFGVLSYSMRMRRLEIGIRLAVGAKRRDIMEMIARENLGAIFVGLLTSVIILLGLIALIGEGVKPYVNWQALPMGLLAVVAVGTLVVCTSYFSAREYINSPVARALRSD